MRGPSSMSTRKALALASLVFIGAACSTSAASVRTADDSTTSEQSGPVEVADGGEETTTTVPAPTTTSTTQPTLNVIAAGLKRGMKGPQVQALEENLDRLKYDTGKVDGTFDTNTWQAVIAFQKVEGLPRKGVVDADTAARLSSARVPDPLLPAGEPDRIEVDLKRQVLFLYQGGLLAKTEMISSGGNYKYCSDGKSDDGTASKPFCSVAITPGGSFKVYRKIKGERRSALGVLYNPLYFNGGVAIHGEPAVPTMPASHGCVRIPMSVSAWFFDQVPNGEPVYVFGGKVTPVPFSQLGGAKPPADPMPPNVPTPTTSTLPTTTTVKPGPTTTTPPKPATTVKPAATTTTTHA